MALWCGEGTQVRIAARANKWLLLSSKIERRELDQDPSYITGLGRN
ncbi:MAG: hypothetical protein WB611_15285 [Stellaceae bacterium]